MAEMKIDSGPLTIRVVDDQGTTVAALRYPEVSWQELVIATEDADLEVEIVGKREVRLSREARDDGSATKDEGERSGGTSEPLDAARQIGESLDVLVRDFARGVKDLLGL